MQTKETHPAAIRLRGIRKVYRSRRSTASTSIFSAVSLPR